MNTLNVYANINLFGYFSTIKFVWLSQNIAIRKITCHFVEKKDKIIKFFEFLIQTFELHFSRCRWLDNSVTVKFFFFCPIVVVVVVVVTVPSFKVLIFDLNVNDYRFIICRLPSISSTFLRTNFFARTLFQQLFLVTSWLWQKNSYKIFASKMLMKSTTAVNFINIYARVFRTKF